MLSTKSISCQRGRQILWENLNITTHPRAITFVRGANGQGKSSLLRILAGISAPHSGEILWQGVPLKNNRAEFHTAMTYLGHNLPLKGDLNALNNLAFLLLMHGLSIAQPALEQALANWGLSQKSMYLPTKFLSQGQKQRVCLAQLSLSQSPLWILDEPFNGLDMGGTQMLLQAIAQHLSQEGSLVITSHLHTSLQAADPSLSGFSQEIIDLSQSSTS